ncbi:MAG: hypothetical protein HUU01_10800 [Saprospiraceae bacterium]|nr:hypothetical protein [Saprospiraceae bacterium]
MSNHLPPLPRRRARVEPHAANAGAYTEYLLLENGQLFVQKGLGGERTEIPSAKKRTAKSVFKRATALLTDSTAVNYPGNMYYFLQRKDSGVDVRMTWGAPGYEVPPQVKALYDELTRLPVSVAVEK